MAREKQPLDIYDIVPEEQRAYLMNYGKHFNTKMYYFAVKQMRDRNGKRISPIKKEDLDAKLREYGLTLENDVMHDAAFVYCMVMSDFMGSSIEDEVHICQYVKDLIDDKDQADGFIFARFVSDCINKGQPIDWEEML